MKLKMLLSLSLLFIGANTMVAMVGEQEQDAKKVLQKINTFVKGLKGVETYRPGTHTKDTRNPIIVYTNPTLKGSGKKVYPLIGADESAILQKFEDFVSKLNDVTVYKGKGKKPAGEILATFNNPDYKPGLKGQSRKAEVILLPMVTTLPYEEHPTILPYRPNNGK